MKKEGKMCNCGWPGGTCDCKDGDCGCCSADDTKGKNGTCRCKGWCGPMCKNCNGKVGKIGKLVWLLVLAWLLRWLRSSFMWWWTDIDIDTTPDNAQDEAIWWQKIWLVADEEEIDPVEPIDPVDPEIEWEVVVDGDLAEAAEVDEADLNEIVELLEDVLE